MPLVLDIQKLRLLPDDPTATPNRTLETDLLVAGGGMGGCAAALAACRAGRNVILTEETDWLGGQMTSQGVAALDEHRYIESFGGTRSYYELRELIREYYRRHVSLTPEAAADPCVNPGGGWVSHLCFEPRAALWALQELLRPFLETGRLQVLLRHKAVAAAVSDDTVHSLTFRQLDSEWRVAIRAAMVLDATELGDLLPLTGAEHVVGRESVAQTGEPSALPGDPATWCVQSFTYPFALERSHRMERPLPAPANYPLYRQRQPYTLRHFYDDGRGWVTYGMFTKNEGTPGSFWTYRRLLNGQSCARRNTPDVAMINWPGNDYRHGNLLADSPEAVLESLVGARNLALGFCRWLQTECPRDGEGTGYPELALRPDVMGTDTGLAKFPYVRESRRIRALTTVREQDVAAKHLPPGHARARLFPDSGGIGWYMIDIHACEGETGELAARTLPFQIPLGALVPVRLRNLLPACKNLGVTHITNGAYRLHPVEWNIGETAGTLAAFCLDRDLSPETAVTDESTRRRLQRRLVRQGVPLHWYPDVPLDHPAFEATQLLAAWGVWTGDPTALEFSPERSLDAAVLRALTTEAPAWAARGIESIVQTALPRWETVTRADLAPRLYKAIRPLVKQG